MLRVAPVQMVEPMEARVERLVLEYAQGAELQSPLPRTLSLRDDLAIESLSLVALTLRLGGEFDVDVVELGVELRGIRTVGDLIALAGTLQEASARATGPVGSNGGST